MTKPVAPSQLAAAGFAAALAVALLIPLARAWHSSPDLGHGWGFPLLAIFLWWERRSLLPPPSPRPCPHLLWLALAFCLLAAAPLRLLLELFPVWPVALYLYLVLLLGLALTTAHAVGGRALVGWLGAPLLILPGVLPWPTAIDLHLITPVRHVLADAVAEVSNALGRPALASGTSVRLATGWVGIDEACGGIRSMHAAVTAALFAGEWLRLRRSRRVALIGLGFLAALLGNFLRVLFLAWQAGRGSTALERWHDPAGWLALGLTLVLTAAAARWLRRDLPPAAPAHISWHTVRLPRAWLATAALGLIAVELGSRAWFAVTPAPVTLPAEGNWTLRLPSDAPEFRRLPLTDPAREMLRPHDYRAATWRGPDGVSRHASLAEWRSGQEARVMPFEHNPVICLPYAGGVHRGQIGELTVAWGGHTLPFAVHQLELAGQVYTLALLVWDPENQRPLVQPGGQNIWGQRWALVREGHRDAAAQLMAYAVTGDVAPETLRPEISTLLVETNAR